MEEAPPVAGDAGQDFAPGRIMVKVSDSAPPGRLAEINRDNNARVEERLPEVEASVVDLPRGLAVKEAVERYDSARGIEYAEPDYKVYSQEITPDDEYFDYLYGLDNTGENLGQNTGLANADINAPEAWESATGSSRNVIAVVDTGVQVDHPDLRDNVWTNADEIPGNDKDDDGNGYVDDVNGWDFHNGDRTVYDNADVDDHGTHVAGTIAAEGNNGIGVSGVNWQARIMPLKFLGSDGGFTSDAVRAMDYAVDNGASISNHSWGGGGYSLTLQESIERAGAEGHLIVAAAGNESADNDSVPSYPASYENSNIISVAATNNRDELAGFSNYGAKSVDLAAPGASIVSTLPGGYGYMSGTSMAAPHVTGSAALLAAAEPGIGASEIKERLLGSVSGKSSLENRILTGGRLNAAESLGDARQDDSSELTLKISNEVIKHGASTGLVGRLTSSGDPVSGEEVTLLERPYDQKSFSRVPGGEVTTNSNGVYRLKDLKPGKHTRYRARFAGSEAKSLEPAVSGTPGVKVRVRVPLRMSEKDLKLGDKRVFRGLVIPNHTSEVKVTIKRNGEVVKRKTVNLSTDSEYRSAVKPGRTGRYAVSARFYRDEDHWGNRSPTKSFKVVR